MRTLDKQHAAGFLNIRKRSVVEKMLLNAEEKLKKDYPDHPGLQTPNDAITKSKSRLKKLAKKRKD
jgi:hypothetical protein